MFHNIIYKINLTIPISKKPLAVSDDQSVLLRGDSGYRIVQRGRVRHHLKQIPFPNTKKTKAGAQILRVASLVLDLWLSHHRGACCIDLGSIHKTFTNSLLKVKNYTLQPEKQRIPIFSYWWGKRPT